MKDLRQFLKFFRRNANGIAVRYGGPVFLVGSACTSFKPNDYDIICVLTDAEMRRNFGPTYVDGRHKTLETLYDYAEWETLVAYYELKSSRLQSARMCVPVDFKIQTVFEARESGKYKGKPSIRCDGLPDWVFAVK